MEKTERDSFANILLSVGHLWGSPDFQECVSHSVYSATGMLKQLGALQLFENTFVQLFTNH